MAFIGIIIILILLLGLIIGFWIGLFGLRGSSHRLSWWLMAAGLAAVTIAPVLWVIGTTLYVRQMSSRMASGSAAPTGAFVTDSMPTMMAVGALITPAGGLLFAAGFALHGMEMGRAKQRAQELEDLAAAMGEELTRFREAPPLA